MKKKFNLDRLKDQEDKIDWIKLEKRSNFNTALYDWIYHKNNTDYTDLFKYNNTKIKNKSLKSYFDSFNTVKKKKKKKPKNNISKVKDDDKPNFYVIEEKKYANIEPNLKFQLIQKIKNNWVNKNDYINLYKIIEVNNEENFTKEILNYSKKVIKIE